jgi:hypothetical protein
MTGAVGSECRFPLIPGSVPHSNLRRKSWLGCPRRRTAQGRQHGDPEQRSQKIRGWTHNHSLRAFKPIESWTLSGKSDPVNKPQDTTRLD